MREKRVYVVNTLKDYNLTEICCISRIYYIIDGSREILKLVVLYNGIIRCINGIPVINTVGLPFRNRALLFNPICSCTHYLKCLILTCSWNLGNTMILLQNYKNFVLSWNQKPPASRCDTWAFDRCPSEQWWPDYKNSPI